MVTVGAADGGTADGGAADGGCSAGEAVNLDSSGCVPYHVSAGQSIGFANPPFWSSGALSESDVVVGHPEALLCTVSATGGGCGAGQACVPKPSPGGWSVCTYQAGNVDDHPLLAATTCPADWLSAVDDDGQTPVAVAVATSWDVSGACTSCDCEPDPEAGCADATLTLYTDPSCQSAATTVGPGACALVGSDIQSAQYSATPVHAGCTASQSEPTGIEASSPDGGYIVCYAQ